MLKWLLVRWLSGRTAFFEPENRIHRLHSNTKVEVKCLNFFSFALPSLTFSARFSAFIFFTSYSDSSGRTRPENMTPLRMMPAVRTEYCDIFLLHLHSIIVPTLTCRCYLYRQRPVIAYAHRRKCLGKHWEMAQQ